MSRVLLVNAPSRNSEPPRHYPYGLAILTSILVKEGVEVHTFDGNFNSLLELEKTVKKYRFDFIGLSGLITTFIYQQKAIQVIRRADPNVIIGSGGGLASAVPNQLLEFIPELNVVFIGEGEISLLEFLKNIRGSWGKVRGIAFREGVQVVQSPSSDAVQDLDSIPLPDLNHWFVEEYFKNRSFELSPITATSIRRGNVLTARGCPFKCDFCFNILGRNSIRYRTANNILRELSELVDRWHVDFISFLDESFLSNKRLVGEITEGILDNGWKFKWGIAARSTCVSPKILKQLKKSGCDYIYYGFDSGSAATLKQMNKRITLDDNFTAFKMTVKAGIYPVPNLIIGYDNETKTNIRDNYAFLNNLIEWGRTLTSERDRHAFQLGFNNFGAIYFATPYPGSLLYERNKHHLPPLYEILTRISGKDAYELTINVSTLPDDFLIKEQRKLEKFVRGFKL